METCNPRPPGRGNFGGEDSAHCEVWAYRMTMPSLMVTKWLDEFHWNLAQSFSLATCKCGRGPMMSSDTPCFRPTGWAWHWLTCPMPMPTVNPKIWAFAPSPNIWSRDARLDLATGFAYGQISLLMACFQGTARLIRFINIHWFHS